MKKILTFLLVAASAMSVAFAQSSELRERVTEEGDDSGLFGAAVVIAGTQVGTQTGPDGSFRA